MQVVVHFGAARSERSEGSGAPLQTMAMPLVRVCPPWHLTQGKPLLRFGEARFHDARHGGGQIFSPERQISLFRLVQVPRSCVTFPG